MRKLISVFLILTVLLVGLAGFAMADTPKITGYTMDEEGNITLELSGENLDSWQYIYFEGKREGSSYTNSWSVSVYRDEETGKWTGSMSDNYLTNYPDMTLTEFRISGYSSEDPTYSSDEKTMTSANTQYNYTFIADKKMTNEFA